MAGAAAMIALVNVASRLVGFARTLVLNSEVGPNALGDAYQAANTLPNVMFEVAAGGALAGAVVPLVAAPLARAMRQDVDRTASALLGWSLVVLVPLAVLTAVLARPLVGMLMPGASAGQLDVAGGFLAVFAPQIPMYGVGLVLTGVLQAHRRFLAAAMAPLLNSLVVIATFVAFGQLVTGSKAAPESISAEALALLGWGTTAGVAVMSLPLLWPVHRLGVRLRPTLRFPDGVASRARSLAFAGLGALVAQQVSVLVGLSLATRFGEPGTYLVYTSMQAVYFLPYAVLAFPLATASLPRLAEHAARGRRRAFAALASSTTRAVLLVSATGAAALVAAAPAVEQVFGPIADGDVTGLAVGLTWTAPGLLGFGLVLHLSRALYALDQGRAAVLATAAGWLLVSLTGWLVVPVLTGAGQAQVATLQGLGIANTLGMTAAGLGLLVGLVRAAGRGSVAGLGRTAVVLLGGGVVGALAGRWCVDLLVVDGAVVRAVVGGVVGALVCVLVLGTASWALDRSVIRGLRSPDEEPAVQGASADSAEPSRDGRT